MLSLPGRRAGVHRKGLLVVLYFAASHWMLYNTREWRVVPKAWYQVPHALTPLNDETSPSVPILLSALTPARQCCYPHLGCDVERPVPTHCDLLLHDAEAIEPAEQEASTVHTKVEVYVITCKPAQKQRRSGSDWA